ncbi:GGDEF domain-containing protein [Erwiniaceae bacterium L1_54_6]|nr:GGDEF domain-containing protein [Erwiniaceae bacterium L1_54_6]
MIISYAFILGSAIVLLAIAKGKTSNVNIYFIINLLTVFLLTWFIRKSFKIYLHKRHFTTFRIGLFLLLNSTLASMAGGLTIIDRDTTSLIAAVLYAPAILLFIYSFNNFINVVNERYKSVVGLSLTDELTGLPNRRHMNMKLKEIENTSCVICIMDIDDFKKINDSYGHDKGDSVLRQVGAILKNFIDDKTFIARSGGEEFSVIITGDGHLNGIIEDIKNSISLISVEGILVTVSIGVSEKMENQTTSCVLSAADSALYQSKHNGKNKITYYPVSKRFLEIS